MMNLVSTEGDRVLFDAFVVVGLRLWATFGVIWLHWFAMNFIEFLWASLIFIDSQWCVIGFSGVRLYSFVFIDQ